MSAGIYRLGAGTTIDAEELLVSGTLEDSEQDPAFDLEGIVNDSVRFVDNGTNLDSQQLPLPEVDSMLESIDTY